MLKEPRRCRWTKGASELDVAYHDTEWGVPVHDDRVHFEFLILEGAQAGLSWETVLKKRDGYRRAFRGFDPAKVARFGAKEVERLLADPGIVRNRRKIEAAISNAKAFLDVQREFGSFDAYVWRFAGGKPLRGGGHTFATTPESDALSKDLKGRGFKFAGSTIMYAFMQATGLVNDHDRGCFRRNRV